MRLLLAEDDMVLRDGLTRSLQQLGYAVDSAKNGADANHALAFQNYDLLILDLGLPKMDGLEVLKRLRFRDKSIPVLILTARDAIGDRVAGLDLGADDYLTKPFDLAELEARVRALVRRGQGAHSNILINGPLMFNIAGRRAYIDEAPLELSARELGVLEILLLKAGQVVGKEQLAEKLCNWDEGIGPNAIEVYVHRLRKKLEPANIQIRTIRGLGYLLEKTQ